jgi:hypothetical protein
MLDEADWESIYRAINSAVTPSEIVYGRVIKRDTKRLLIWIKEFGDQPIPLVGFNGIVSHFDTIPEGNIVDEGLDVDMKTVKKTQWIEHEVPRIGQTAVVLRQFGRRRLPKCIGIILSKGDFTRT